MVRVAGSLIVALIVFPSLASAGPPADAAPPASWEGFHIGVVGGGAWARSAQTNLLSGVSNGYFPQSGAYAGGSLGYNLRLDRFVLGFETDLSWSDIAGEEDNCGKTRNRICSTTIKALGTARARAGVLLGPGTLLYATGGLAYADLKAKRDLGASEHQDWIGGWTVGGGVEQLVMPNLSVKLEYLHADFPGGSTTYTVLPSTPVKADERNLNTLRAGASYHF